MAERIEFTYKGTNYTLEYTRKTVEMLERQGFKATEITEKPVTVLPGLFAGAFLAHHRFVKREHIDEIFSHMTNRGELIDALARMYNAPIMAMMEEPDETEGNVTWGVL